MITVKPLGNFLSEYVDRNIENKYPPVAVGRYGIRTRESIYSKELAKDYSKNKLIRKNTLTVGMGSNQVDIGILSDDKIYSVSPAYHTYNIKGINVDYLRYCLEHRNHDMFVRYAKRGSRQGKTIDFSRWLNYAIPVYSEEIQSKIVNKLNKVSFIIKKREKLLKLYDQLAHSLFIEMFGDPIYNSKNWQVVQIGDIAKDVRYGTSNPAVEGGKYPYLRMNNITVDGKLDLGDLKYIDISDYELEKYVVRKGDLLFNRTNSIELVGKTTTFDLNEDMIIAGYIIRVRLNNQMLPEVLSQYMNLEVIKSKLRDMAKGAVNQANINAQELQSIRVYLPDIDIQKKFVKIKCKLDKSKLAVKKSLEELEILKKSLMQKYFA